ncbi:MAG: hypothetical protein R3F62_11490 [Planctomycetota bacterium]
MKFSGRLGNLQLPSLIRVLKRLRFQGTVRLRRADEREQALLVFEGDRVHFPLPEVDPHRRSKLRLRGEKLLERVCAWSQTRFDTFPERVPPPSGGSFWLSGATLERLEAIPGSRGDLSFSAELPAPLLPLLGRALGRARSTGVLLVDDGRRVTSVFYHAGTPFRRTSAREPGREHGQVVVRWAGGLRGELVEHPERFAQIRAGWPARAA